MAKKVKKEIYPNSEFYSMKDYVEFCKKHGVFGGEAYAMKRRIDKKSFIPEPKVEEPVIW